MPTRAMRRNATIGAAGPGTRGVTAAELAPAGYGREAAADRAGRSNLASSTYGAGCLHPQPTGDGCCRCSSTAAGSAVPDRTAVNG